MCDIFSSEWKIEKIISCRGERGALGQNLFSVAYHPLQMKPERNKHILLSTLSWWIVEQSIYFTNIILTEIEQFLKKEKCVPMHPNLGCIGTDCGVDWDTNTSGQNMNKSASMSKGFSPFGTVNWRKIK